MTDDCLMCKTFSLNFTSFYCVSNFYSLSLSYNLISNIIIISQHFQNNIGIIQLMFKDIYICNESHEFQLFISILIKNKYIFMAVLVNNILFSVIPMTQKLSCLRNYYNFLHWCTVSVINCPKQQRYWKSTSQIYSICSNYLGFIYFQNFKLCTVHKFFYDGDDFPIHHRSWMIINHRFQRNLWY